MTITFLRSSMALACERDVTISASRITACSAHSSRCIDFSPSPRQRRLRRSARSGATMYPRRQRKSHPRPQLLPSSLAPKVDVGRFLPLVLGEDGKETFDPEGKGQVADCCFICRKSSAQEQPP